MFQLVIVTCRTITDDSNRMQQDLILAAFSAEFMMSYPMLTKYLLLGSTIFSLNQIQLSCQMLQILQEDKAGIVIIVGRQSRYCSKLNESNGFE